MAVNTAADEYRLATFYFESKAYTDAARMLEGVLAEEPPTSPSGCCWPAATTTPPNSTAPRPSCAGSSTSTRSRTTPG